MYVYIYIYVYIYTHTDPIHICNIYIYIYTDSSKYEKWKIPFCYCLLQVIPSMQSIQCLVVVVGA